MNHTEHMSPTQEECIRAVQQGVNMLINSNAGLEELTLGLSFYLEMAKQARFLRNAPLPLDSE